MAKKTFTCKFHGNMLEDGDFKWKAKKGFEKKCAEIVKKTNPSRGIFYAKREDKNLEE